MPLVVLDPLGLKRPRGIVADVEYVHRVVLYGK